MTYFKYTGVNLPAYSFGPPPMPGSYGVQYTMPGTDSLRYWRNKGMTTVHLNIQWERAQPKPGGPLDETYMKRVDEFASECARRGMFMVLGLRSFAEYWTPGGVVALGSATIPVYAFGELWVELASRYVRNEYVVPDLMNEPKGKGVITTELWRSAANSAIWGIRAVGYSGDILVCGNGYSGAASWSSNWYGTPNAVEMLKLKDPFNRTIMNVHSYWDADGSGEYKSGDVTSSEAGLIALRGVTSWARANGKALYLGEFGTPNSLTSRVCTESALAFMSENIDVWKGWSWWAAGPWWGSYKLSIEPRSGADDPRVAWLDKYR